MSYEILKGWPDEGALDVALEKESGEEIEPGMIVTVNDSGNLEVYTAEDGDNALDGFVIDYENAQMNINPDYKPTAKSFTVLFSGCVIGCDSDHYDGDPSIGDTLTADGGKFKVPETDSNAPVIGKVFAKNSSSGYIKLVYFGNR